jgi:hypothetical protein
MAELSNDTDCLVQVKQGTSACNPGAQPPRHQVACVRGLCWTFVDKQAENSKIVSGQTRFELRPPGFRCRCTVSA